MTPIIYYLQYESAPLYTDIDTGYIPQIGQFVYVENCKYIVLQIDSFIREAESNGNTVKTSRTFIEVMITLGWPT